MRVAVGFFDGVHLGHRAILAQADCALTFVGHPLAVLSPERTPKLLMTCEERLAAIRACGVSRISLLDFTPELAALSPEDFLAQHLRPLAPEALEVVCGEDWTFGAGGRGTSDFLRAHGVRVNVVPAAIWRGRRVSSTRIRAALNAGEVAEAGAMLGSPYAKEGRVFEGKGLGRRLGFPTLNLEVEGLHLATGVYVCEAAGVRAVANWGRAPTSGAAAWERNVLEVHLLAEAGAVPSSPRLTVKFLRRLRDERRFPNLEALSRQLRQDVQEARR